LPERTARVGLGRHETRTLVAEHREQVGVVDPDSLAGVRDLDPLTVSDAISAVTTVKLWALAELEEIVRDADALERDIRPAQSIRSSLASGRLPGSSGTNANGWR